MTSSKQRWIHFGLTIAAIACSAVSLFALVELDGPRWTISLNALSIILIALAMRTRGSGSAPSTS
jgi:hypothetical protein